ncbi:tRNA-U20-dihydrouridine synthase [Lachnospiraceae bacterium]|nr:tRNA-U20-dihydrouridine synthase [Lachnospiraceae bacterium]
MISRNNNMKLDFNQKIILGPMAGVTDLPFRILCKEQGADVCITEMVSAKGLMYGSKKTDLLLKTSALEKPVGIQLFGNDPGILAGEAAKLSDRGFDFIDINMGCPVPKIVNNGEGSALMKNVDLIEQIVRAVSDAVSIPVTVKIRTGFDADHINAVDAALAAESGGAAAVAVHARTREQYYSGRADWSIIKAVKDKVKIPVIGNGDIRTSDDVKRIMKETGCDSVMIARAAKGNPWIFREIKAGLRGEAIERRSMEELRDMMKRHVKLMVEEKGEYIGIREMRKHVAWYTEGIYGSAKLRKRASELETEADMLELIEGIGR